jgi:hypothetical protein
MRRSRGDLPSRAGKARAGGAAGILGLGALALGAVACNPDRPVGTIPTEPLEVQQPRLAFPHVLLPPGYQIEKVADGLSFLTEMTFDSQGRLYVNEAGGGFEQMEWRPPRILRLDPQTGAYSVVIDLSPHIVPPLMGLAWYDGWLYFTHRDLDDTGALSRVRDDGTGLEKLLTGFVDAQVEHFMNGVEIRDGWVYFGVGQAGNSGVLGPDVAGFILANPQARPRPCRDLTLIGYNFEGPLVEGAPDELTGAFVPFGGVTQPGQVIPGVQKCGGAVHRFRPESPEGTLEVVADGIRQPIGLTFTATGELFVGENGYDVRGFRPVKDQFDATLRIQPGHWYGFPDFSAAREPLTLDKFEPPPHPDLDLPRVFLGTQLFSEDWFLDFVIDHQASGLSAPNRSLVAGLHQVHSSPSGIDVAPANWGALGGHLFVGEWGDLTPPTNPLQPNLRAGIRVSRVDPRFPQTPAQPFVRNRVQRTASEQGIPGEALERPFDVKFGPNPHGQAAAMYITDYGIVEIDESRPPEGPPYRYLPDTGVIWRVYRSEAVPPPTCIEMTIDGIGSPGSPPGTISLSSTNVLAAIFNVEGFLPRPAQPGDVRFGGASFEDGTPAEGFSLQDLNNNGLRDILLRFLTQRLIDDGNLGPDTDEVTIWARDQANGDLYCGRRAVTVVP